MQALKGRNNTPPPNRRRTQARDRVDGEGGKMVYCSGLPRGRYHGCAR
jgi:hypothetical protein